MRSAPSDHRRFPLLDPMRGMAAIAILIVHTSIFSIGIENPWYEPFITHLDIGVAFFFMLSAFLLYRPFVSARVLRTRRPSLSVYATRRAARIFPAYWVVLTITAVVPGMVGAFSGNWWVYYGLLQNYPIYSPEGACVTNYFRCAVPPTWSLAVELAFYVMLPFFVLGVEVLRRHYKRLHWLSVEFIAIGAIVVASFVILSTPPDSDLRIWLFYSPLSRGWWFGLGLVLAAISVWIEQRATEPRILIGLRNRPTPYLVAAGGLYVITCLALPSTSVSFPLSGQLKFVADYALFGVIGVLLLMPAIFGSDGAGAYRAFLRHPIPTWIGLISYGIFLWQFPVIIALLDLGVLDLIPAFTFPVFLLTTFVCTVACAALSYYGLERPVMRLVHNRTSNRQE
jgi:peptidoglycan/LPS O-acetylase OafA/YrhL